MKKYYLPIVRSLERSYEKTRNMVARDPEQPNYLGRCDNDMLYEPGYSVGEVATPATLYACPQSKYYKDTSVFGDLIGGCKFMLRMAHEDGTHDYLATNFFTPATFELHGLVRGYRCFMTAYSGTPEEKEVREWMEKLLLHLGMGCVNGGFHTPNHRWVESAALTACYNIFKVPAMKQKADMYLAEGIDCDDDGEFTERSPGMYNSVNDNALMMIAEELNMPELYKYVKLNMDLLFDYMEPDGSIFTQNSRRKDKGEGSASGRFYPEGSYYYLYLWAGWLFGDKKYLKFADEMMQRSIDSGRGTPAPLWIYILHPELQQLEPDFTGVELPTAYSHFYPGSNIYRRRDGMWSYSIIANNPNFLFLRCGDMQVYVRMCASFFAVAQFMPEKVEKTETGFKMFFHSYCNYRRPLDPPPASRFWADMDHSKRKLVHECDLDFTVEFTDLDDGVRLHVTTSGTERVPFKLEYVISPNCNCYTSDAVVPASAGGWITVTGESVRLIHNDGSTVQIDGCFGKSLYHKNMRGSVPQAKDAFTVYSTDFTPIDRTVDIHLSCLKGRDGTL